ncbi:MAG: DNA-directed RNA polymerase subunit beta' [Desulfoplanes sp.]|nr:DNA-directed RNA polymerase subunit beta' [Desulfoplanes sp.]
MSLDDLFTQRGNETTTIKGQDLEKIKIQIASPEKIREWSYGEVKKPETINYRTFKPERDGLFCAKIFGPVKDFECNCGKYKRMKHRGIVCEKCGVEVIASKVRRERMGHIELAAPCAHIWFLKSLPSKIGTLLDMTMADLEKVLYFDSYIILDPKETNFQKMQVISEDQYVQISEHYGPSAIRVGMGAEAVKELLEEIDLLTLRDDLREESKATRSQTKKKKLAKRLHVVEAFLESDNKPGWMILDVVPIIPPDLRPLVPLDGGRFATSDLNDLYRRVINRNNRLKRLLELGAPDIIIRNEKRMLQESVDALFDNGRRGRAITGTNGRPLKSLSDMIKGKQGRFRQNLLGKRVDYSGRSVIAVGPSLRLHQCGLPKKMALELFKPFIYSQLEALGYASTIKSAKKMVEREDVVVWDILENVVKEYPILLNRAPTLHRLGIQAFEPILIEGKAIRLHPLVCTAFNADFDGDQMAVHVPLSIEAQIEARVLMMSTNNILSPANGAPIIVPTQDMVLGLYYLTVPRAFEKGEGMIFSCPGEVIAAYDGGCLGLHARIKVRIDEQLLDTTPGRILIGDVLPEGVPFHLVNRVMDKRSIGSLVGETYRHAGTKATVLVCDRIKALGFEFSTRAAVTVGLKDLTIPAKKAVLLEVATKEVEEIEKQYNDGIITKTEKYNKVVDVWTRTTNDVATAMMDKLAYEVLVDPKTGKTEKNQSFNPIYMMANSGARGNKDQMRQLAGMRGLMAKPSGEIIETPITANFREGLTVLQFFTSTHGARKGLADTALKTANSGYLTRRLVDVAQDVIISEDDCGTVDGLKVSAMVKGGEIREKLGERVLGRIAMADVVNPDTGECIVPHGGLIDEEAVEKIDNSSLSTITIRSTLCCNSTHGVCSKCYGRDLARGHMVNVGEAVGIIAAQSIGEPGTQLTMRTFHIGGTASREIEQSSHNAQHDGTVVLYRGRVVKNADGNMFVLSKNGQLKIVDDQGLEREKYPLPNGATLFFDQGDRVTKGALLAQWDPFNEPFIADMDGTVKFTDVLEGRTVQEKRDRTTLQTTLSIMEYRSTNYRPSISICDKDGNVKARPGGSSTAVFQLPVGALLMVQDGQEVRAGEFIARKPRETSKTKDIVGGLPRVAELFEVRKPKEQGTISEVEGIVAFGADSKGKRRIIVTPEVGEPHDYLIPKGKHILVQEGDFVEAGELLTAGAPDLHDVLHVQGEKYLANYLVEEVQHVYRSQGVYINDKHIEIIVRQMLKKVNILDPGDTDFLIGEHIEKSRFFSQNEICVAKGMRAATAEPLVLGITQASLSTESFISAASFQETTKVLTEAALQGKEDHLLGLKENVIVGRLVAAGTGYKAYLNNGIEVPGQSESPDKFLEDLEKDPILIDS